jgi:hypothetical protein
LGKGKKKDEIKPVLLEKNKRIKRDRPLERKKQASRKELIKTDVTVFMLENG